MKKRFVGAWVPDTRPPSWFRRLRMFEEGVVVEVVSSTAAPRRSLAEGRVLGEFGVTFAVDRGDVPYVLFEWEDGVPFARLVTDAKTAGYLWVPRWAFRGLVRPLGDEDPCGPSAAAPSPQAVAWAAAEAAADAAVRLLGETPEGANADADAVADAMRAAANRVLTGGDVAA